MIRTTAIVGLLAASIVWAQTGDAFKPGKLPKAEQDALVPGLALHFVENDGTAGPALDGRRSRLAALYVQEKTPPSPFLRSGTFKAVLTGYLKVPQRSEYQFQMVAKGKAKLTINGKEVLVATDETKDTADPIELARGYNKIEIAFSSPQKGDATLRVNWSGEGFNLEPLPPDALFSRGDAVDSRIRDGRSLWLTHHCAACHGLNRGGPIKCLSDEPPDSEIFRKPPSLEAAGSRFGKAWLASWILNPRELRPQSTMPAVLHGKTAPQQAADLAAFLASLKADAPAPKKLAGNVAVGEKLFGSLGCVACHHVNDPKEPEAFDRLPLWFVNEKYHPAALVEFLKEPQRHYAWTRMPDFKLTQPEADDLAAFLRDRAKGKIMAGPAGDVARGKTLFDAVGCAQCHALKPGEVPEEKKKGERAQPGCLALDGQDRGSAPNFGFDERQIGSLKAFLAADQNLESLCKEAPAEFSQRQMAIMKCNACHRRDGATSRWFQVMEEEGGSLPENLPLLTWAGEKLQPEWTDKLVAGGIDHRARPWLKARMPAFPARARLLSVGLSHEHGFAVKENDRPAPDAKLAEIGEKLLPQVGGLNCVQCHGVGKTPPVAPFEAPGVNLLAAAQRLRHSYYQRWMLDPPRLDPTTKMIKLAPDGKTTGIRDVFDGDARRQFDAIWHYIQTLPAKK